MPLYLYKVRDRQGNILHGQMETASDKDLRRRLDERQYFLIDYSEKKSGIFGKMSKMSWGQKVTLRDLSIFSWQLYTMLNAALTLVNSLKVIHDQTKNPYMKRVISDMSRRVQGGLSFSEALKEQPRIFSRFFVQMVNVGEVGGVLDEIMQRMAVYYERELTLRSKLKAALTYPIILLVISILAILFLILFVLPEFTVIFSEIGVKIPAQTQFLLDFSKSLEQSWFLILFILLGVGLLINAFLASPAGRYQFDRFQLGIPIWGDLIKKTMAARFTQTLSILVGSGIPILTSLDVVTDTVGNLAIEKVLREAAIDVEQGKPLVVPLQESQIFPELVTSMIRVGEESGALDKMLDKVAQFYQREVHEAIEAFAKMLEPMLMVFMACLIGYIALTIFLPLAGLLQSLH